MTRSLSARLLITGMLATTCCVTLTARAQNRGVYPLGMSATNSGLTPESGFTYVNQLLIYSRDKSKGPDGEVLGTGSNSVVMDMNTLAWVSKKKILGGAKGRRERFLVATWLVNGRWKLLDLPRLPWQATCV